MPIANPMSDSCRAGASLVPSPVTATTSPIARSSFTKVCLSDGEDLAMTYQVQKEKKGEEKEGKINQS